MSLSGRIQEELVPWKPALKKRKKSVLRLYLCWIYNGRFDPFELPSRTAAPIVFECGLMDVGLEIKEINPRRFCLIFKRHLTFLSCVSSLSRMSARGGGRGAAPGGAGGWHPGPWPGFGSVSVTFRTGIHSCFASRRSVPKGRAVRTRKRTQTLSLGRDVRPSF